MANTKVMNNFLGMSYEKQLSYLNAMLPNCDNGVLNYFLMLEEYMSAKDLYPNINSDQRRYLRYTVFDRLIDCLDYHDDEESEESKIRRFDHYYGYEYDMEEEYKKYYVPKEISDDEADEEISYYESLDDKGKADYVDLFNKYYSNFGFFDFPCSEKMIEEYNDILNDLLGEELFEYFNMLYPTEKLRIVQIISGILKYVLPNEIADIKLENPKAVRNKKRTLLREFKYTLEQ